MAVDIATRADIDIVVEAFYTRAMTDPLIGPVFTDVAQLDLVAHLPIMGDFWETALFQAGRYRRNAFSVHRSLHHQCELTPAHFERWLTLWTATVDALYVGPVAEQAKLQASRIAASMSRRLNELPKLQRAARLPVQPTA